MAVIKRKPTSAGRRFVVSVTSPELHKGPPHAPLVERKVSRAGRNNSGSITRCPRKLDAQADTDCVNSRRLSNFSRA